MNNRTNLLVTLCVCLIGSRAVADEPLQETSPRSDTATIAEARDQGLEWLTKNQAADGSWGKTYSFAVTSFACLSYLGASDDPYTGEQGRALISGLKFLLANQTDGQFKNQGHTWIHGQGFATLALSEAYGRSLFAKTKPDIDMQEIHDVVGQAVQVIATHQSTSGGWWYTPGVPGSHEGSTTVCAVQALVSANNYGIEIEKSALARGFEYLKKCQNADGGFDYKLGDAQSMTEGTAGGVATLGLMKKFDYAVMLDGYNFLLDVTPASISRGRFPYYGHFYGCMGMQLLQQEFGRDKEYHDKTNQYILATYKDVLSWRQVDGAWPGKAWVVSSAGEGSAYGTSFAALLLSVPEGRLSIFNRRPPKLPLEDAGA